MKDNEPIIENMKDDIKLQTSMKKMKSLNRKLLTQLLSPRIRSKIELKSPVDIKTEVGVKRGKKAQDLKYPRKAEEGKVMKELTGLGVKKQGRTDLKKMKVLKKISNKELTKMKKKTILNEYENPDSAAFGKTASTVK